MQYKASCKEVQNNEEKDTFVFAVPFNHEQDELHRYWWVHEHLQKQNDDRIFVFKYADYKYMLIYIHRQNRCLDIG